MFARQRASNDSEIQKASTSTVTVQSQEIDENVDKSVVNVDNIVNRSAEEDVDKNDEEKVDDKSDEIESLSVQIVRSTPAQEKNQSEIDTLKKLLISKRIA